MIDEPFTIGSIAGAESAEGRYPIHRGGTSSSLAETCLTVLFVHFDGPGPHHTSTVRL